MTVCHSGRSGWGRQRPLSIHDLLPMLGYEDRDWKPEELPELVHLCGMCEGKGRYNQTYTAGCGGGYYTSSGECGICRGVGLRYANGQDVPISVIVQIVTARQRSAEPVEETA